MTTWNHTGLLCGTFFIWSLLTSCAHVLPLPPADRMRPMIEAREKEAMELMSQGELAEALTQWKILKTLEPNNPEFTQQLLATKALIQKRANDHVQLGKKALSKDNTLLARQEFLKALALDPHMSMPFSCLKEIEKERSMKIQAKKIQQLVKKRKAPAQARLQSVSSQEAYYLQLGIGLLQQGRLNESIREIEKYLNTYPKDREASKYLAEAHLKLGIDYYEKGEMANALMHFEKACRCKPASSSQLSYYLTRTRQGLAEDFYQKGMRVYLKDIIKAIEYWEKSVSYNPQHINAQMRLQKAYKIQKKLREIEKNTGPK
jgi:tetratricopeptide (TPR) repeat protein